MNSFFSLVGFVNIGNTCYLNSGLQCLFHISELRKGLLKTLEKKKNNEKSEKEKNNEKAEKKFRVLEEICDMYRLVESSENNIGINMKPMGLIRALHALSVDMDRVEFIDILNQKDSNEFINYILEILGDASYQQVSVKIEGKPKNDSDVRAKKCYKELLLYYKDNYSIIAELFGGLSLTEIYDINTNQLLSDKPEWFTTLLLPIPFSRENERISLYDCINKYLEEEILEGEHKWYNEKRKEKQVVKKKTKFWKLPKIMIITLKRFEGMPPRKNNKFIDIEKDNLDLNNCCYKYMDKNFRYELFGIINHIGRLNGGHYYCSIKNNDNGKWYTFNDTSVFEENVNKVITEKAYCMFYRKKN
jgi:ubiquitin C-terminal hydrolase